MDENGQMVAAGAWREAKRLHWSLSSGVFGVLSLAAPGSRRQKNQVVLP